MDLQGNLNWQDPYKCFLLIRIPFSLFHWLGCNNSKTYEVILAELNYIQNIVQFVKRVGGGVRLNCVCLGGEIDGRWWL